MQKSRSYIRPYFATNPTVFYRKYPTHPFSFSTGNCPDGNLYVQSGDMNYETGTDGRFRPCLHTKTRRKVTADSGLLFESPLPTPYLTCIVDKNTLAHQCAGITGLPPTATLNNSDWSDFDTLAVNAMLPSANPDNFSILNFIWELKDFRQLASAFWKRKNRMKALILGDEGAANSTLIKEFEKKTLKSLSSSYLNYNFAWAPFVSDIQRIWDKLHNTVKTLENLWARQGIPQTRHFDKPIDGVDERVDDWGDTMVNHTGSFYDIYSNLHRLQSSWRSYYELLPEYRATMRYTYQAPGVLDTKNKILGWLDAFGVRLDPSIIWNAIPFTFLIDWVVDVGGFLRRFKVDNLNLNVTIEDFCSSQKVKVVKEHGLRLAAYQSSWWYYTPWASCSYLNQTTYERILSVPDLQGALIGSPFSPKEISLAAALLVSGGRNRGHWSND